MPDRVVKHDPKQPELTQADIEALRRYFRYHWTEKVAFNKASGLRVDRWDPDGCTVSVDYREDLSAHPGMIHGGVIAAVIDTCGGGAVMAGHDFAGGTRLTTVSMSIQYTGAAPGEGIVAHSTCTKRGRKISYCEVRVVSAESGKPIADAIVTTNLHRSREGIDKLLAIARARFS
jgi:uncharacterized protein (TIGR00369 family)